MLLSYYYYVPQGTYCNNSVVSLQWQWCLKQKPFSSLLDVHKLLSQLSLNHDHANTLANWQPCELLLLQRSIASRQWSHTPEQLCRATQGGRCHNKSHLFSELLGLWSPPSKFGGVVPVSQMAWISHTRLCPKRLLWIRVQTSRSFGGRS